MNSRTKDIILWTCVGLLLVAAIAGGGFLFYRAAMDGFNQKAETAVTEQQQRKADRDKAAEKKMKAKQESKEKEQARKELDAAIALLDTSVIRDDDASAIRESAEKAIRDDDTDLMNDIVKLVAGLYSYSENTASGRLSALKTLHSGEQGYYDQTTAQEKSAREKSIEQLILSKDYRKAYSEENALDAYLKTYDDSRKADDARRKRNEEKVKKAGTCENGTLTYSDRETFMTAYKTFASQQKDAAYQMTFADQDWTDAQSRGALITEGETDRPVYIYRPSARSRPVTVQDGRQSGTAQQEDSPSPASQTEQDEGQTGTSGADSSANTQNVQQDTQKEREPQQ